MCDDAPLGKALRARGSDVVLSQRLEQRVTRHPGIDRREQQREHGPGQDHVREEATRVIGDRDVPRATCQVQRLPEDEQGHQPQPEDRRRDAEQHESHRARSATVCRLTAETRRSRRRGRSRSSPRRGSGSNVRGARSSTWLSTDTGSRNEKPSPGQPYSSPVEEVLHEVGHTASYQGWSSPSRAGSARATPASATYRRSEAPDRPPAAGRRPHT